MMVYAVLLFFASVLGVHGTCLKLNSDLDQSKIATMCHSSIVEGVTVFIDMDVATTTTATSAVACTCNVKVQRGKTVTVNTFFGATDGMQCGTSVRYSHSNDSYSVPCDDYADQFSTSVYTDITVDLQKHGSPGIGDYCALFTLAYCSDNQFQCNNGICIDKNLRCDGLQDCTDESDEAFCTPASCSENFVLCDDGKKCISPDERCDGDYNCPDLSDESAKHCDPNFVDTGSGSTDSVDPNQTMRRRCDDWTGVYTVYNTLPPPLLTITCDESSFLPQHTTTTSSTSTTTQSTTTPSTTTSTTTETTPSMSTTTTTTSTSTATTPSASTATPTKTTTTPTTTPTPTNSSTPSKTSTSTTEMTTSGPTSSTQPSSTTSTSSGTFKTTAKPQEDDEDDDEEDDKRDIMITGIITGILALILIIFAIIYFCRTSKRDKQSETDDKENVVL